MKKLIIIDDDPIVNSSLSSILKAKNYDIVANGFSTADAILLYDKHKPDLLLMDIRMGESTGLDAAKNILEKYPDAKILLITTFQDKEYIDKAMQLGCKGYILKENISGLASAIDAILNGKIVYDSKIMEKLIQRSSNIENTSLNRDKQISDEITKFFEDISSREKDVLKLVADGLNNKEISEKLFLSEGTVRNYISSLLSKLGLRDRTQLAIYYYQNLK